MTDETPGGQQPAPALEDKILAASQKASEIVSLFAPGAAQAVAMGVQVEPVVSGLVKLFIHFFQHHIANPAPAPAK